jgi:RNA polymerase sigma-70 factor (ECF subfamily)
VVEDPAVLAVLERESPEVADESLPDARLKLLFVCAHPAIDEQARTPLMLQAVFGLDAARVASAFLVAPATMAQRLVRAKQRIRYAGVAFEEPGPRELPGRLHAVLEAIYAAYGTGWEATLGPDGDDGPASVADPYAGFAEEALYLAGLVAALLPGEPEALGLQALLGFSEARRAARLDDAGRFVPLVAQDTTRWDHARIAAADQALWHAAQRQSPGPFQLEAAIQSAHCQRAYRGSTPWPAIAALYEALMQVAPSIGSAVGRAVAVAEAGELARGLALLDALAPAAVASYQPFWVARAHLLALTGSPGDARRAFERALGLTRQRSLAAHLRARQAALPPA